MRKNIILSIFKKELKEVLRDKRMLLLIVLLPFFMYPVIFSVIGIVGANQSQKVASEKVTLLVSPNVEQMPLAEKIAELKNTDIQYMDIDSSMIDSLSGTIGLQISTKDSLSQTAQVIFDGTKDGVSSRARKLKKILKNYESDVVKKRLAQKNLPESYIHPIDIKDVNLATKDEEIGKVLGGFLPMMLMIFIFIGCIYIAIDITAGEKERKTLQTLFTTPVKTREIIAGKFLAVISVSLVSAFMNLLSLGVAMFIPTLFMSSSSGDSMDIGLAITTEGWIWLIVLVLLIAIFLSALTLAVVLLANTYKEAQSYVSPLMMLVMIPSMLTMMPGMELDWNTVYIPILNISLAMSAILKGNTDMALMITVVGFTMLYALLALFLTSFTFNNENVITGQKVQLKDLFKKK